MTTVIAPPQHEETSLAATNRRTVNQTLCAATHVVEGLADYVVDTMDGHPRAGAPSLTEDPVALMRHACAARRLRLYRDVACCLIAVAVGVVMLGQLADRLGLAGAVVALATVIAGWLARRPLMRWLGAWCLWAWRSRRDRRQPAPIRWLAAALCLAALALVALAAQPVVWSCLAVMLTGLVLGWLVVVSQSAVAHHNAAAIVAVGAAEPRQLAPSLGVEVEQRLAQLSEANLVVYGASRAPAPFVGNGFTVRPAKLDIDVHRRAVDTGGEDTAFTLLDIVAFHEWLEAQFQVECAVESTESRRLSAGHRLYIDGRRIPWGSDLLEAEQPVPRLRVSWDYLREELRHPQRAADRRVYFYLQETDQHGEIAVCIFVRALLQSGKLSVEFVPLVLPPFHPDVEALVDALPSTTLGKIMHAIRICSPRTPATVFGAPMRCALWTREWLSRRSRRANRWLAARYGWTYDHGAVMSVREGVCWRKPDEFGHFIIRDLIRINDHLKDRLIASIRTYLGELGVDTAQVEAAVTINNIQNWSVGNVRADMVGFGNNNTFGQPGRDAGDSDKG